jgi:hypothetical protein
VIEVSFEMLGRLRDQARVGDVRLPTGIDNQPPAAIPFEISPLSMWWSPIALSASLPLLQRRETISRSRRRLRDNGATHFAPPPRAPFIILAWTSHAEVGDAEDLRSMAQAAKDAGDLSSSRDPCKSNRYCGRMPEHRLPIMYSPIGG